jgi:phenylpropionate dioxygenase-like ring-hydroxylating dioxygenase large terminal subunit
MEDIEMETAMHLDDDATVIRRILDHIDNKTTDLAESTWREPVESYLSPERLSAERDLVLRRYPVPFCPSAALDGPGSFVARDAAGTPILAVRGIDSKVRAFRNACRHRGTQLASGAGCEKSFVCRYHGWTYALDGSLRHVPHEHGFPGLDKSERGLVALETVELQGVVFVTQDGPAPADANLHELPPLIPAGYRLAGSNEIDTPVNWKILAEGFLEGYHIRSTHPETFYPVQFDNLNVVERFGRNNRIAFPFRAIHKTRSLPDAERNADGKLTFVYHLFPNVMIATFPGRIIMVVLEPLATDNTRMINYQLTNRDGGDAEAQGALERGGSLITAGALEDREMACAIQRSLASGANEFFEFGRFEGAIGHFHRALHALVDAPASRRGA